MAIALVTGGNRGLGYATALRLGRGGHRVIISARREADGVRATQQLRAEGIAADHLIMDVTDVGAVRAAAEQVDQQFGAVDILINNAGVLPEMAAREPAEIIEVEMFTATYATNVFGAVAVLEAFLPLLRRSRAARIVNVSTVMGSLADQTDPSSAYYAMVLPAYQSSKAALNNVTVALHKALADTSITVTSVCPGFVQTDLSPINRDQAPLTADQAAETVADAAAMPVDDAAGAFVDANGPLPW